MRENVVDPRRLIDEAEAIRTGQAELAHDKLFELRHSSGKGTGPFGEAILD